MLLTALGGGSLAAGLAVAGDIAQRAAAGSGEITAQSLAKAANEFGMDSKTALQVISGKSIYDEKRKGTFKRPDGEAQYSSIRKYADSGVDDGYLFTDSGKTNYRKNRITQAAVAARDAFAPSSEDFIAAKREMNRRQGLNPEGPRHEVANARIPLLDGIKDQMPANSKFGFTDDEIRVRQDFGLDTLKGNIPQRVGSILGRTGSDFLNNGIRSWWWLVNAPQAVSDLVSEGFTGGKHGNREGLYGSDSLVEDEAIRRGWISVDPNDKYNIIENDNSVRANRLNVLDKDVNLDRFRRYVDQYPEAAAQRKGDMQELEDMEDGRIRDKNGNYVKDVNGEYIRSVSTPQQIANKRRKLGRKYKPVYSRRRTNNNLSTALALPSAIGINAGLGLVNITGAQDGYKALYPSEEDPTRTSNVLQEIAGKYILGRRGDILPWEEFKKVRPDVSKGEYMSYKGYKYGKDLDVNPFDDGKLNLLGGIVKHNSDGIDGAEVQFLGKSMPYLTTIMPTAMAIGGATLGASLGEHGYLNEEGFKTKKAEYDSLGNFLKNHANDKGLTDNQKGDIENMHRRFMGMGDELSKQRGRLNSIPKPIRGRMRNTSAIASGLLAGSGALIGSNIIAGELERRRREGKIQEREERGY